MLELQTSISVKDMLYKDKYLNKDVHPQYLSYLPYYSRHGQDKYVNEEVLKGKRNGIFVDIGAYDGIESSNTLFYEETLNWRGICVEPLQDAYNRLVNNRNSICINKCASDRNEVTEFLHIIPQESLMERSCHNNSPLREIKKRPIGDSSLESNIHIANKERVPNYEKMSGITKYLSPHQISLMDKALSKVKCKKEYIKVEVVDINDILSLIPDKRIDLLSIDAEGSEIPILKAIKYYEFYIDVIIVEVLDQDEVFINLMKNKGYKYLNRVGYDHIYTKTS